MSLVANELSGLALAVAQAAADATRENALARGRLLAIVWLLLGLLAIVVMGFGLLLWAVRRARRIRRIHAPKWTDMPDLWFLNPPEGKKDDHQP